MTVSAVLIYQNEKVILEKCLNNLKWVDEVIAIDGGSRDGSFELVNSFRTKDFPITTNIRLPFRNHFGDQKNFGCMLARSDWIFVIDADEGMEKGLKEELVNIANSKKCDAVAIPRYNFIDDKKTDHYPDYQYRFFRSFCRYVYPVHEELTGYRKCIKSEHHLLHFKSESRFERQQVVYEDIGRSSKSLRRKHEFY